LRLTDEKGLLLKGGLGVLLPMTDLPGAKHVLAWMIDAASQHSISIEADVFSYNGKDEVSSEDSNDRTFDRNRRDDLTISTDSNSESASVNDGNFSTSVVTQSITKIIRADSESQVRKSHLDRLSKISTVPSVHFCPKYPTWKRTIDICGAAVGLAFAFPIIALAGIAIKLTSRGPIFFRQMRSGQYGRPFPMYKLRTMVVDAEELKAKLHELNERDGPAFKIKNDPRVTRIGNFLRKTGMDELPQLWNVLMGHMAIVGPRPLPCNEDIKCKVWQRRRLDTKPGLTCIWQISKSRKVSFDEWMRMDLHYADKRTIIGDFSLMVKTVMAVFLGRVGH
jgi:lipopolysaccharide/colanic/teichoic acid biosynthesis glycosyltransferase